jgi:hypothetical protein
MAVPCNWNDYSQWWSVEPVLLGYTPIPPCSGCPPFMVPKWADLMTSWTAPTKLITNESSLAVLRPRVGTLGSPAQHLGVGEHVIIT